MESSSKKWIKLAFKINKSKPKLLNRQLELKTAKAGHVLIWIIVKNQGKIKIITWKRKYFEWSSHSSRGV